MNTQILRYIPGKGTVVIGMKLKEVSAVGRYVNGSICYTRPAQLKVAKSFISQAYCGYVAPPLPPPPIPSICNGGTPSSSGSYILNGGSPSSTSRTVVDGGIVSYTAVPPPVNTVRYSGGTPSSTGTSTLSGGTPSSTGGQILNGGGV